MTPDPRLAALADRYEQCRQRMVVARGPDYAPARVAWTAAHDALFLALKGRPTFAHGGYAYAADVKGRELIRANVPGKTARRHPPSGEAD